MSDVVFYRFQPDAMDRGTLERLFTGKKRKTLMKKLTKELKTAVKNRTPRYYLFIGPRGVGKTHFVTLLYSDVEEQIGSAMPVKLSEEEFSLYRVSDLLLRILELSKDSEIDLSKFERMSDDEVVVSALEELKSTNKMIVLFMENLNQILGEQMSKQEVQKLRSIFQTENIFTVVTTAPLIFPQVSEHEEPFFNFFDIIYLKELTREELKELVMEIARIENNEVFLSKMGEYGQKIDAVYVLTGGSPRMAMLLYDLMSKGNLVDVEKAFLKLLDENTPYYQDVFRLLSGGKRKVFDTLIELGKPATPKEIAEKARLEKSGDAYTQLRRLEKDGYVISRRMGKTTKYEVRERLFRLWRELRRQPFAMQKLSILVEFLELWYSLEERKEKFLERFEHLRDAREETIAKEMCYWFLSLPKGYKRELMPRVVKEVYEVGKVKLLDELVYGDKELKEGAIRAEFEILLEKEEYEVVLKKAEEMIIVDENDAFAWLAKGAALGILERHEEALVATSKGVELDSEEASAWLVKGMALRALERYEEALLTFSKALDLDPKLNIAWRQKGVVLIDLERYEEALEALSKALEFNQGDALAWYGKGLALRGIDRPEEALDAFSKSTALNPKDASAWFNKGSAHLNISTREFESNNYGNALENINSAMKALDSFSKLSKDKEEAKEGIKESLTEFVKELIDTKNVEVVEIALLAIFEKKKEFKELFEPIHIAVEIVKSRDVSKFYDLQVEMREVVAEIVNKLTGSEELLPEEYKGR